MPYEPVHEFKDITLRYVAPGGATLQFFTDMPGGQMALRRNISMPASGAVDAIRKTFPLDENGRPEGRLYRVKVIPPSNNVAKLLDGHLSAKRIGVYIDGSLGNVWETDVLSVGA